MEILKKMSSHHERQGSPLEVIGLDMMMKIFQFVDFVTIIRVCRLVSKQWFDYSKMIPLALSNITHPIPFHSFPSLNSLTLQYSKQMTLRHALQHVQSKPFQNLTSLTLKGHYFDESDDVLNFPSLKSLELINCDCSMDDQSSFFDYDTENYLREWNLIKNINNLQSLNVRIFYLDKTSIQSLVNCSNLKNLTILNLGRNSKILQGIESIATSPNMKNLTWLNVIGCGDFDEKVFQSSPYMKNLNSFANDKTLFRHCSMDAIKTFLRQDGHMLEHAPDELKNDKRIVLQALEQDSSCLRYASDNLRNDKQLVLQNLQAFRYVSNELKNDREIVWKAVNQNYMALHYASDELKNDREIVLEAINQSGMAISYASDELQRDKEIVLKAVRQQPRALKYLPNEMKQDKEIVLEAVIRDGWALADAAIEMKSDKEVVLAAVRQNGFALNYASDELRNDRDIVLNDPTIVQ